MTTIRATVVRRGFRTGLCVKGRKGITDIVTQIGEKVLARLLKTVHGIGLPPARTVVGRSPSIAIRLCDMCQHQADQLLLLCNGDRTQNDEMIPRIDKYVRRMSVCILSASYDRPLRR